MAQRPQLTWRQMTAGLLFLCALSAGLGLALAAVVLGVRSAFEPPLRLIVALPAVLVVMVVYGNWVWIPLWKMRAKR